MKNISLKVYIVLCVIIEPILWEIFYDQQVCHIGVLSLRLGSFPDYKSFYSYYIVAIVIGILKLAYLWWISATEYLKQNFFSLKASLVKKYSALCVIVYSFHMVILIVAKQEPVYFAVANNE